MSRVLVTGGTGFVASHCIVRLLQDGHSVRTTVRSLDRAAEVQALLERAGVSTAVECVVADLTRDDGWRQAVDGCEFVQHVASPFPLLQPQNEEELIAPARDGALRVLGASMLAGVRRVVLTSSFAAVGYGHVPQAAAFDETRWTNTAARVSAYVRSKTLAERAAWEFVRTHPQLELSVVNPVGVFGPVLGAQLSTSVLLVKKLLDGSVPAVPKLHFGVVDVRDVAELHAVAMQAPQASGERWLAVSGDSVSMFDVAQILRRRLGAQARRVPKHQLPNWLVRVAALKQRAARQILPDLGVVRHCTSAKAQRLLGWQPRSIEDAIVASAESLLQLGLV